MHGRGNHAADGVQRDELRCSWYPDRRERRAALTIVPCSWLAGRAHCRHVGWQCRGNRTVGTAWGTRRSGGRHRELRRVGFRWGSDVFNARGEHAAMSFRPRRSSRSPGLPGEFYDKDEWQVVARGRHALASGRATETRGALAPRANKPRNTMAVGLIRCSSQLVCAEAVRFRSRSEVPLLGRCTQELSFPSICIAAFP